MAEKVFTARALTKTYSSGEVATHNAERTASLVTGVIGDRRNRRRALSASDKFVQEKSSARRATAETDAQRAKAYATIARF